RSARCGQAARAGIVADGARICGVGAGFRRTPAQDRGAGDAPFEGGPRSHVRRRDGSHAVAVETRRTSTRRVCGVRHCQRSDPPRGARLRRSALPSAGPARRTSRRSLGFSCESTTNELTRGTVGSAPPSARSASKQLPRCRFRCATGAPTARASRRPPWRVPHGRRRVPGPSRVRPACGATHRSSPRLGRLGLGGGRVRPRRRPARRAASPGGRTRDGRALSVADRGRSAAAPLPDTRGRGGGHREAVGARRDSTVGTCVLPPAPRKAAASVRAPATFLLALVPSSALVSRPPSARMPRRQDIESILLLGSGPIVIGQACEFDYSGTQACKALRQDGFKIILINSNPATIMTDPETADRTYVEPITPEVVEKIIAKERPDAVLPTLGGQTALNTAMQLADLGVFERYGVEMLGATRETIAKAESRDLFRKAMQNIGLDMPRSRLAYSMDEALAAVDEIGLPCVIRPGFTLGGTGGGIAYNLDEFREICQRGFDLSLNHELLIDESLIGWKEFELEVMRDHA